MANTMIMLRYICALLLVSVAKGSAAVTDRNDQDYDHDFDQNDERLSRLRGRNIENVLELIRQNKKESFQSSDQISMKEMEVPLGLNFNRSVLTIPQGGKGET